MKIATIFTIVFTTILFLFGCGIKGPLYLPGSNPHDEKAKQHTLDHHETQQDEIESSKTGPAVPIP